MIDMLSKHAPSVEVVTLCAALLGAWTDAPVWLAKSLAIIVGSLALVLFGARARSHALNAPHEPGSSGDRSWIEHELAGKGTPSGFYVLAFFGFVTIALTGFESPYAMLAWAGFALGIVWGIANRNYPADEERDV